MIVVPITVMSVSVGSLSPLDVVKKTFISVEFGIASSETIEVSMRIEDCIKRVGVWFANLARRVASNLLEEKNTLGIITK